MNATGQFHTPHASKYLQQLAKHFSHKIEVSFTETDAELALPPGSATLHADNQTLTAHISAEDDAGLVRAKSIIDKHLERFAFRENFEAMDWQST
nr:DUF2218 domain-containing protein [uncultured Celeribacter sp.]